MPRESEKHIIDDEAKFNALLPKYEKIIKKLEKKYHVVDGSKYYSLVNFKTNTTTPKHNWFIYKQGYAEELVRTIIQEENPSHQKYILDPFCGVGTTNLVAQSLGYKSLGFDINPVAVLAATVKTTYYSNSETAKIKKHIDTFSPSEKFEFDNVPKVVKSSFVPKNIDALLRIKFFIENKIENQKIKDFFLLAYLSIIEDCSIRTKDGNGLKLNTRKKQISDVYGYFLSKCRLMLSEISLSNFESTADIYNASMYAPAVPLKKYESKVGLSIFSPPYANCFDYCEVYKLEFWLGGFVKDYGGFKYFREMAMRSHVNSGFDHTFKYLNPDVDLTANLISAFNIWNKNIPDMLRGYFDDTYQLLKKMHPLFATGGKCYIVVANSGYRGVLVPTDLFIAEIAEQLGYKVDSILNVRKIRASSQQMVILHNNYTDLMRESIIILEKN